MIFLFHFWVIVEVQNLNFQGCIHIVYPSQKTHTSADSWNGTISKLKACLPFPAFFRGSRYVSFSWSNLFKRNFPYFSKWSLTCLKGTICFWPILIHIVTVQIGNWRVFTVKLLTWSIGSILRGFFHGFPSSKMLCLGWKLPCSETVEKYSKEKNASPKWIEPPSRHHQKTYSWCWTNNQQDFSYLLPSSSPPTIKKVGWFPFKKHVFFFVRV